MLYGLPENPTREDMRREQDLKRVYLDFGIDSQGVFYRRLKPDQDLFEQTDSLGETPEQIRSALENPFFFGGSIFVPGSLDQKVPIPEGSWRSEDGKAYRDPGSPAQIARATISEILRNSLNVQATLTYTNVALGSENRGLENFQDREDIIKIARQEPTIVERTIVGDDFENTSFEAHVVDTDNPEAPNYWADVNANYIVLDLEYVTEVVRGYRRMVLQRIVVGSHEWTEVMEQL